MKWIIPIIILIGAESVLGVRVKEIKAHIPPVVRVKTRVNGPYIEVIAKRAKWGKSRNVAGTEYYNYITNQKIKANHPTSIKIGVVKIKGKVENSHIQNRTYYKNLKIKVRNPDNKTIKEVTKEKKLEIGTLELDSKNVKNKQIKIYNYIENLKIK